MPDPVHTCAQFDQRLGGPYGEPENPDDHYHIIRELDFIAEDSDIPKRVVYEQFPREGVSDAEIKFMEDFLFLRDEGHGGLLYLGEFEGAAIPSRLVHMCGVFRRNGLRARTVTVPALVERMKANDPPVTPCLIIKEELSQYLDVPGVRDFMPLIRSCIQNKLSGGDCVMLWIADPDRLKAVLGPMTHEIAHKCTVVS